MLDNYQISMIVNIADNLMRNCRVAQPLYQEMMQYISPNSNNPALLQEYCQYIEGQVPYQRWASGIQGGELERIAWPWIESKLKVIFSMSQQRQRSGGGYGGQAMTPGGYGSMMSPQTPVLYSDGSPGGGGQQQQPPYYPPPQQQPQSSYQVQPQQHQPPPPPPQERQSMPTQIQLSESNTEHFDKTSDNAAFKNKNYACGEVENIRVSFSTFEFYRSENTIEESHLSLRQMIPGEYMRGYWTHMVNANILFYVPMKTEKFLKIATEVAPILKDGWKAVVENIGNRTNTEFTILDRILVKLINYRIDSRLRVKNSGHIIIESVNDLAEVRETDALLASKHNDYRYALDNIIESVFQSFFDPSYVIEDTDKHFGDFVHCHDVKHYDKGYTEYDYGMFSEPKERKDFFEKLMEKNTVLRRSTLYLATNMVDDIDLSRVKGAPLYPKEDPNNAFALVLPVLTSNAVSAVDSVICYRKGSSNTDTGTTLKFGTNLDRAPVLYTKETKIR